MNTFIVTAVPVLLLLWAYSEFLDPPV